ncbi:D-alanyl-D-alanine carboxypeptidase [Gammaproteobacteria bacterium]|nr:D-alanyl-D-alanine carboxypeptidase [Gammaproteobacteria bacterium]
MRDLRTAKVIFCLLISMTQASTLSDIAQKKLLMPPPPSVSSEAYILIDAATSTVIAEKNADQQMRPASLTKLLTTYVIFNALSQGHVTEEDEVRVSTNAWKIEGSRMFLGENTKVDLKTLIKGTIITSANDASIALSEHYAGSEQSFAMIMNRIAQSFGMGDSSFVSATGLEHDNHYSTARDLANLSQHIINDFPQYFHWFSEESITYGNITQNNRNQLIQAHPEVDGLKTGYTKAAGYCLASTAKKGNTRLILVTLNAPSTQSRNRDTMALLNYGFRFYDTELVYPANTIVTSTKVYQGILSETNLKTHLPYWITVPKGSQAHLKVDIQEETVIAPVDSHTPIGRVITRIDDTVISEAPLYSENDIQLHQGLRRYIDRIKLLFKS